MGRCRRYTVRQLACVALMVTWATAARAADWPTYNHDARRSATTSEGLNAAALTLRWTYVSKVPIQPAWPGPAPRDYYNSPTVDNADRLDLDAVFQVAAAGDSVLFGSASEDTLWCLDAATGLPRWHFMADGPVRFAPHVVDGRVYFGADDGVVYCLSLADGALLWRTRIAPSPHQVPSDGKLVSLWPNRSGVVVRDGTVYCAGGVFPSEGVFVCALDALTGSDAGQGHYRQRFADMSLQGYVLASAERVYFPGGRAGPWVFDRVSGERKGQLGGGGGSYAVVSEDDSLIYGPGKTSPTLEEFRGSTRDSMAYFPGGRHIVVTRDCSYVTTSGELICIDRQRYLALGAEIAALNAQLTKHQRGTAEYDAIARKILAAADKRSTCYRWQVPTAGSDCLILAGAHLYAGGPGTVAAMSVEDGACVWQASVGGVVKGLAVANGRLLVSTDKSRIYCFW
jgi:outer membrane protein assembly factor BamB